VKNYSAHRHDFLEFSFVIEGSGWEVIDGAIHQLQPGVFTFILPFQIHEILIDSKAPLRLYNCNFDMELLFATRFDVGIHKMLQEDPGSLPSYVELDQDDAKWMLGTLKQMRKEIKEDNVWRNAMLHVKLIEILIRFDRIRRNNIASASEGQAKQGSDVVRQVMRYIHNHYRDEITLSLVAKHFHMSPSTLSKMFKTHLGSNFLDFLHEVRIRHACSLLQSTEMSISQISYEVGYGSYQTFSRVFLEHKQMTPSAFRKSKACTG
jgi:AraC-like DNA-binding protein